MSKRTTNLDDYLSKKDTIKKNASSINNYDPEEHAVALMQAAAERSSLLKQDNQKTSAKKSKRSSNAKTDNTNSVYNKKDNSYIDNTQSEYSKYEYNNSDYTVLDKSISVESDKALSKKDNANIDNSIIDRSIKDNTKSDISNSDNFNKVYSKSKYTNIEYTKSDISNLGNNNKCVISSPYDMVYIDSERLRQIYQGNLQLREIKVLLYLYHLAKGEKLFKEYKNKDISDNTNIQQTYVPVVMKSLEKEGFIEKTRGVGRELNKFRLI